MAHTVILGAGPTGLSTAYHLEKLGFHDYILFEKEKNTGGLCRSIQSNGFTYDYTGHLLHINNDYMHSFMNDIVGFDQFNTIRRKSFIFSQNTYTHYPFQTNLYGLPQRVIEECIEGYKKRPRNSQNPGSFHSWVVQQFGQGFGKYFFFPYQKKIFAYDIRKITPNWTGRFVPQTSLEQIIKGAQEPLEEEVGYNAQFFYPKQGGIQFWLDKLTSTLAKKPLCEYEASSIDLARKIVTFKNGHQEPFKKLVSTIPLDNLLYNIKEQAQNNLKSSAHKLACNSVININLGIKNPAISDKHWIYFPEDEYPFYRLGFYHNFSPALVPAGCSSLYAEYSTMKKNIHNDPRTEIAKKKIKTLFKLSDADMIDETILTISHAYVIYNSWREQHLPSLLKSLAQENIYSIGRYGAWKYSSMQEAILEGKVQAEDIAKEIQ